jgi:hypothetical protein
MRDSHLIPSDAASDTSKPETIREDLTMWLPQYRGRLLPIRRVCIGNVQTSDVPSAVREAMVREKRTVGYCRNVMRQ